MADPIPSVYVVDDDESVRQALARLLEAVGHRVKVFSSAEQLLAKAVPSDVGCLILDVRLPGASGLGIQQSLLAQGCDAPIVFLTGHGDIPMAVGAVQKGALDFLTKPVDDELLLGAIDRALAEHARRGARRGETDRARERFSSLTPRELEVLRHVISGARNRQVAAHLGISEKTVKIHRGRAQQKIQATSLVEMVEFARQAGVSPLEIS